MPANKPEKNDWLFWQELLDWGKRLDSPDPDDRTHQIRLWNGYLGWRLSDVEKEEYKDAEGEPFDFSRFPLSDDEKRDIEALEREHNIEPVSAGMNFVGQTFAQEIDFSGLVFWRADFEGAEFSGRAIFAGATFSDWADFQGTTFSERAYFTDATFSKGADLFSKGADFTGAEFSKEANFTGAEFSGEAHFTGATFSGSAHFTDAAFSGEAHFTGAEFSKEAIFVGATFSKGAYFKGVTFPKQAYFYGATFSEWADFENATFSEGADFGGVTFSGRADFENATFSERTYFQGATFKRETHFTGATFSKLAHFGGVTVSDWAEFENATFSDEADFQGATFSKWAYFKDATFSGKANFEGAEFSGQANFEGMAFSGWVNFVKARFAGFLFLDRAIFNGLASFQSAEFTYPLNLAETKFTRRMPEFQQAKLHEDTSFADETWPPPLKRPKTDTERAEIERDWRAYQAMARIMNTYERFHDRHFFYRREIQARRALDWQEILPAALASWFYELFCDSGFGLERVLAWWLGHIGLFAGVIWALLIGNSTAIIWLCAAIVIYALSQMRSMGLHRWEIGNFVSAACFSVFISGFASLKGLWSALVFSFSNAYAVLGLNKIFLGLLESQHAAILDRAGQQDLWPVLEAIGYIQAFLGPIFLFLLSLTLRNRFRMG